MGSSPPADTGPARETDESHHALPAHEVVLLLETDVAHGLSAREAAARLVRYGPNVLPESAREGIAFRFLRQFHHPLIYVLLAAGAVTLLLGALVDSSVIFAVVLLNAGIGFIQESKAEAALDALRSMVRTRARVRRDGQRQTVESDELVPGDVVLVGAGDKVPADIRLVTLDELRADESALTGEALPVAKDEVALHPATAVADRRNMLYSGTLITHGTGCGVVVATGTETELGEIHRLVGAADTLETPLTRKLAWFSKVLTVAILALAALTFAVGLSRGEDATEMFTAAVALAVGAIPEGLPAAVTITLAIGVSRMAHRRAVVRRMPAVETLGSTTVVCSDKTGTLTENQMTVRAVWTPESTYEVTGSGYAPDGAVVDRGGREAALEGDSALRWTLVAGATCNDARLVENDGRWSAVGDPTEAAMLVAAAKLGYDTRRATRSYPRRAAVAFSSERRYMATCHDDAAGDTVVFAKGAVERVLDLCRDQMLADGSTAGLDREAAHQAAHEMASGGLRVLATAVGRSDSRRPFGEDHLRGTLTFTGLQAMLDPPRPEAIAAVASCHQAGIDVKMITGDHATTAAAIARQLGIVREACDDGGKAGDVLTGPDLDAVAPGDYDAKVEQTSVFARVSPEQKLRLVRGLQARGHVVTMTGDGVNDAPALQQADIGVAMGAAGTEVAKEAADMVLTDDDFATIEAAVEEGRGVFDNLTKFIVWTLPTNMGEGFVILVAILLGTTLPISPVQILWINMTTAVALGLMLAFEPKEDDIMRRPPRDPTRPILTRPLVVRILLVSALLVGGALWLFEWEQARGASIEEARTSAVNLFVTVEAFYLVSCRSLKRPIHQVGIFSNRWVVGGLVVQALGQLALTYAPAMNRVFGTAPIGIGAWASIFALAVVAATIVGIDKALRRSRSRSRDRGPTRAPALRAGS